MESGGDTQEIAATAATARRFKYDALIYTARVAVHLVQAYALCFITPYVLEQPLSGVVCQLP
jgi:hypothetical protein